MCQSCRAKLYTFKFHLLFHSNSTGGLVATGAIGMFMGGVLIKVMKLELVGMIRLNIVTALVGALFGLSFLAGCPNVKLVGQEIGYYESR